MDTYEDGFPGTFILQFTTFRTLASLDTDTDAILKLRDHRNLGYRLIGDPGGTPLFFFHGTPGSRHCLSPHDLLAQIPGLLLILPDRPGYGLSDPQPDRQLTDWAGDVLELADHLDIETFAVCGASGGGPHVLACACMCPDRITHAFLFSSPAPASFRSATKGMSFGNRLGLFLNGYASWIVKLFMNGYARSFQKDPDQFIRAISAQMSTQDRRLLDKPEWREALIKEYSEAYRQGAGGHILDARLTMTTSPWGFDLKDVKVPVYLWWGEEDILVTETMAEFLAAEIPDCLALRIEGTGHFLTENVQVIEEMLSILGLPKSNV